MKRRLPKLFRSKNKPYRAKSRGFGRGFETLEERTLMAGDVAVSVVNNMLNIVGDANANDVAIYQQVDNGVPTPGTFTVAGLNGTTINSNQSSPYFTNVKNIYIDLGAGDDHVTLGDGNINHFVLTGQNVLDIYMGSGNDSVTVKSIQAQYLIVAADTRGNLSNDNVYGYPGNDTIDVQGNFVVASIDPGNGNDNIRVHDSIFSVFYVGTDDPVDGNKVVDLSYVTTNNLHITTGTGNDTVSVDHITDLNGNLDIRTGDGVDNVSINATKVRDLNVDLGTGDDSLRLTNVQGHNATLDGGAGYDQYFETVGSTVTFSDSFSFSRFDPIRPVRLTPYTGW